MASWDTPVVSAPQTRDYAPPVQDFSSLANLLQDFVKGRQMGREEEKAQLFRNGIPKDAAGNIDVGTVTEKLARINPDYAMPLINLQMQGQLGQSAASAITNPTGAPQTAPAAPGPTAQPSSVAAPRPQMTPPAASAPPNAPTSIISMIPDGVSADDTGRIASQVANEFKLDPNAAPDPKMVPRIRARIANLTGVPLARPAAAAPQAEPVSEPGPSAQPPAANPVTPQPEAAQRLDYEAALIRARAAQLAGVNPKAAEVLNKEADTRADKAKQLRDQAADAPAIKEWRQSGSKLPYEEWIAKTEGDKETAKRDAETYSKKYDLLVDNGVKAQNEIPQLELMQTEMNDPNFFSGAGEKYNLLYKRLKSAVGIDPEAPVPQEMLRKITSNNILSSLGALKGLGQIRVAEINLAKDAAASPDNSVPANKFLVETSKRVHQRNAEIAEMAQAYKEQNGALDAGFDKKVTAFYKAHPLFSDAEVKDWHRIIGEAPKAASPGQTTTAQGGSLPTFRTPAEVAAAGLPSGTKFLDGNGVTRRVP